jgi:hypothetical protein
MQLRERGAADDLTLQGKFWSLREAAKVFGRLAIVVADRLQKGSRHLTLRVGERRAQAGLVRRSRLERRPIKRDFERHSDPARYST